MLKNNDIDLLCAGLVLGAEGETENTLMETLSFVREIKKIGNTASLLPTPFIPLPGSPSFRRLLKILETSDSKRYLNFSTDDNFDLEELVEVWNFHMSKVSLSGIQKIIDEIAGIFEISIKLLDLNHSLQKNT